ncbi:sulfatase [Actinomadura sp. 9N407]|uniref:sulfatase n=1 Tax=Actinomadura sp. 9N407 TaxID=3375154 RepID=UPI00378E059B
MAWVFSALACLLVLFVLLAPIRVGALAPKAFARIPVEALFGVFLILVLPARARRVGAVLAGVGLGVLAILKIMDMGFLAVLARPFHPVLDWISIEAGLDFVNASVGRAGAIGAVIGAVVLAVGLVVVMTVAMLRVTRLVVEHDAVATASVSVLAAVWTVSAVLGAQLVPGVEVASKSSAKVSYYHARQIRAGLQDQKKFAKEAGADAFRDVPDERLLTALRGKDVLLAFVESYGRDAVEDPEFAPRISAVLDAGDRRLRAKGYASRSAFLTSSTAGGGSWLAHATTLSGVWIDNQQRYRSLVSSDRMTLNRAFQRADWRTVGVVPGITKTWPEGAYFGYDQIYTSTDLGYRGPKFSWATMPDQYTLSAFERLERAKKDRGPLMAEIPLLSSHAPWASIPRFIGWNEVGDGSVYNSMPGAGNLPWPERSKVRAQYRSSIEYTLNTLISYVETYGDDDLVLVFLGDHQPAPLITGEGAGRDVPITILARDPAVLDRISGWGWQDGLKPGPQAPVWRMNAFRDRFLTAFSPEARGQGG